ncbi:thiamine biosynthesis/tRNA modification protein ThiI [Pyrobaculum islandicum DSM 4184]|uniref:tRNA sulfurtransferase n=1 Tax=Pyrobaculum islandicum (strain DSM 4184 / JCM 9189 / GEO3) TaxID=384616 RepID=A1RT66_PYRIL|nr:tRNA uracil 4-sulfurtransferase ThiI [Pyrobaculum islandicum]ABL88148.1 thiamine biosynthesis/tRNA modification protein ThiI [Pyrobaculum islandicum DSM 4184]
MERVLIVRVGELTIKRGKTRVEMERLLLRAAKEAATECGNVRFVREPGRIYALGDIDCLRNKLSRVFGVKSVSPAYVIIFEKIEDIVDAALKLWGSAVAGRKFAVRVHRVGEHSFTSRDIAIAVGAVLTKAGGKVDLENPEVELFIEVRNNRAFLYTEVIEGPGGLPIGSEGKVLALVSGGIDSPVAAWMMMRRGAHVDVFYCNLGGTFVARLVVEVIKRLLSWSYGYNARVVITDCAPIGRTIRRNVKEELWNIAFKRALYLTARKVADIVRATALVTGESLGQVSSQTLQALAAVERGLDIPVMRPLVGMDKDEIIQLARKIGTYELSIKIPEYCAIFSKRPKKWATREEIEEIDLAIYDAVIEVVKNIKIVKKRELDSYIASLSPPQDIEIESLPPDAVLIDLRDQKSFQKWHLPGALRADPDDVLTLVDRLGHDKTYVFYCYSGGLSLDVAESLRKFGVKAYSLKLRK